MDNGRVLLEELRYEHMGRDGDPVCDLDGHAPMGYGGVLIVGGGERRVDESQEAANNQKELSDPTAGPLWLAVIVVAVCVGGGFAVGWAFGAWLALGPAAFRVIG